MSTSLQTPRENESRRLGLDLVMSMANMGLKRDTERGVWPVLFNHIFVLEDERGILRHNVYVIDAKRLPVRTTQIADRGVLGTLSAVARRRVFVDPEFALAGVRYGFALIIEMSPRPKPQRVALPQSVRLPADMNTQEGAIALGVSASGPVFKTRKEIRGLIVAGAPRTGKSNLLRSIALQAARMGWRLFLVDPQEHTFPVAVWERLAPVSVTNCVDGFNAFLVDIEEECARRSRLFNQHLIDGLPPEDLEAYNAVADEALPPLVLIVDEFNSFALRVEFADIARRNQKYGLMCVLAAHSWRARNVPPELSELMQSRVCFRVESMETARAVVHSTADARAALHLEGQGRAITNLTGQYETMQVYLVEPGAIAALAQAGAAQQFDGRPVRVSLSDAERAIADAVIAKLGGVFSVDRLRRVLAGSVSDRQIRNASARWAAADRRWFEASTGAGRPLSARFYEQAGLTRPDRIEQGMPLASESGKGGKADQGGKAGKGQGNRTNREADEVVWIEGLIARRRPPDRLEAYP